MVSNLFWGDVDLVITHGGMLLPTAALPAAFLAFRPLMARNQPITEQRTTSCNLRVLTHLFGFLRPYRKNLAAALLALFIAAGALLGFGMVLQRVVALQFRDALGV